MTKKPPCPACDMHDHGCKPLMAMALGVALGDALDTHAVTDLMCDEHRKSWVMAMCHASVMLNTVDGEPALGDEGR